MDVHGLYTVYQIYSFYYPWLSQKLIYTMYILILNYMVKRMKANITHIESTVTPSGNSGHVVVPKAWIGKEAIVKLKEKETRGTKKK